MTREIRRLAFGFLLMFGLVALTSGYWGVLRSESMTGREDNPRRVLAEQSLRRGLIVDRNGVVLATNRRTGRAGTVRRAYPYPDVAGVVGYYSYQYGTDGLENAFDDLLRGEGEQPTVWETLVDGLLHRPRQGADLRSTIDLRLQQRIAEAMGSRGGAAVVISAPDGAILAMVSRPKVDPNRIDENWVSLTRDKRNSPLLNRVIRGLYQPGGSLEIVLLAGMLNAGDRLTRVIPNAAGPILIEGMNPPLPALTCVSRPPDSAAHDLTLLEAFAWGCPRPFVGALGDEISYEDYYVLLLQVGLLTPPPLDRLTTYAGPPPLPLDTYPDPDTQAVIAAVGQGQLTVTPLQMAWLVAAIANQGNAPPLHLADAYRQPDEQEWRKLNIPLRQPALLRVEVATQVRDALRFAAENSPLVQSAAYQEMEEAGYRLYGHASIAYSGQKQNSWFLGFIDLPGGSAIVVVVVIENAQVPDEAAQVAGEAFRAAIQAVGRPRR